MPEIIDIDAKDTTTVNVKGQTESGTEPYSLPVDLKGFDTNEKQEIVKFLSEDNKTSRLVQKLQGMASNDRLTWAQRKAIKEVRLQVVKEAGKFMPKLVRLAGERHMRREILSMDLESMESLKLLNLALSSAFIHMEMVVAHTMTAVGYIAKATNKFLSEVNDPEIEKIYKSHYRNALSTYEKAATEIIRTLTSPHYPQYVNKNHVLSIAKNQEKVDDFMNELLSK